MHEERRVSVIDMPNASYFSETLNPTSFTSSRGKRSKVRDEYCKFRTKRANACGVRAREHSAHEKCSR